MGEIPPDDHEVVKLRERLSKMHLLDALDFVNDVENEMSQDTRTTLLCELVQELKERLPKSYARLGTILIPNIVSIGVMLLERNYITLFTFGKFG